MLCRSTCLDGGRRRRSQSVEPPTAWPTLSCDRGHRAEAATQDPDQGGQVVAVPQAVGVVASEPDRALAERVPVDDGVVDRHRRPPGIPRRTGGSPASSTTISVRPCRRAAMHRRNLWPLACRPSGRSSPRAVPPCQRSVGRRRGRDRRRATLSGWRWNGHALGLQGECLAVDAERTPARSSAGTATGAGPGRRGSGRAPDRVIDGGEDQVVAVEVVDGQRSSRSPGRRRW